MKVRHKVSAVVDQGKQRVKEKQQLEIILRGEEEAANVFFRGVAVGVLTAKQQGAGVCVVVGDWTTKSIGSVILQSLTCLRVL
jgi:hypothetical protein